jgi:hypothetical protein
VEFIERIVSAAADFFATPLDRAELGFGGRVEGQAASGAEVHAERLAHQLALGTLLAPAGLFDLAAHPFGQ